MNSWSYSYSEALWNHKALLVSVEDGLFGFPVQGYEYGYDSDASPEGEQWYYLYHSYYYLFRIDFTKENPIPEPVVIEHPSSDNYYVNVDRAVMVEGYVYTLSDKEVIAYDLAANAIVESPLIIPQAA
jgi:Beta propeller domain.